MSHEIKEPVQLTLSATIANSVWFDGLVRSGKVIKLEGFKFVAHSWVQNGPDSCVLRASQLFEVVKPSKSGHPKGATHYSAGTNYKAADGEWFHWRNGAWERCAAPALSTLVDVDPEPWNGEGLPPVGTVCEYRYPGTSLWKKCEILCVGGERVFYRDVTGCEAARTFRDVEFRPIPVVTARETAIAAMMTKVVHATPHDCALLYDANYRKVPDLHLLATRLAGVLGPVGAEINFSYKDAMLRVLKEVLG